MSKTVIVPIANGIEELEAITIIDVLRRSGLSVRVSSIEEKVVTAANGLKIHADSIFTEELVEDYDAIVLPGGSKGAESFSEHPKLITALKHFLAKNWYIAAICASPALVLAKHGLLKDKNATCYPYFKNLIPNFVNERVVVDGNIITSQGPGTALDFAFRLAEIFASKEIASKVRMDMLT